MRFYLKTVLASLLLAGMGTVSVIPAALAGADDGNTKAFWLSEATQPSPAARSTARNQDYKAVYSQEKTTTSAPATAVEKDPPAYNHAMGTMSAQ